MCAIRAYPCVAKLLFSHRDEISAKLFSLAVHMRRNIEKTADIRKVSAAVPRATFTPGAVQTLGLQGKTRLCRIVANNRIRNGAKKHIFLRIKGIYSVAEDVIAAEQFCGICVGGGEIPVTAPRAQIEFKDVEFAVALERSFVKVYKISKAVGHIGRKLAVFRVIIAEAGQISRAPL